MKIGIIREEKNPPDQRVPFSPVQCKKLKGKYPDLELVVQPSDIRSFKNEEYETQGINLQKDLSDCDILMGVKEVPKDKLIPNKKYFFFSHTIKEQPYNQELLKTLVDKGIQMIDYECLTHPNGARILGFGRFAGIVGAYNALIAYGKRYGLYDLKPAHECYNKEELKEELNKVKLPPIKIVLTGYGRVGHGAAEVLDHINIKRVFPDELIKNAYDEPVFTLLDVEDFYELKGPEELPDFFKNSDQYPSAFGKYAKVANMFISCHYWDGKSANLFELEDTKSPDFKIKVIADITCDINGSVPTTIRPSEVHGPVYGFNPQTMQEDEPYGEDVITVMAVDNLPSELPRDASEDFGSALMEHIIPVLLGDDPDSIIKRASITKNGDLTADYEYLRGYLEGK